MTARRAPGQGSLFDLAAGRAGRDEGMDLVADHNPDWFGLALMIIAGIPRGWTGLPEDLRPVIEARIGPPTHANAYGALLSHAKRLHLLRPTGKRRQMRLPGSHARMTDEYVR